MIKLFQLLKLCVVLLIGGHCNAQDYQLVWSDEFNKDGCLDESIWNYEQGYARNEELQWYQSDNAWCQGGLLVIEARSEKRKNPLYKAGSYDWRTSREYIECTSSSITTFGKKEVSIRPRACFSPSYNKVKSQTKHVWLLTLL